MWDRDSSICSFIKKSIRDDKQTIFLFEALNGKVYNEIQADYIGLRIMGYFCV